MDRREDLVDELLVRMIVCYAPRFGAGLTEGAARKLATAAAEAEVETAPGEGYVRARAALSACGTILEENAAEGVVAGVILSGAARMNPAYLLLRAEGGHIRLKACAKEGLIKQHTAERALETFRAALAGAEEGTSPA